jgi:GT2 family glycosyltransferase
MIDLSICIVTQQARDYLHDCLQSIEENSPLAAYEIIVVDNASSDGTLEMLQAEFPAVQVITNDHNTGFTAPMNQALRQGSGHYLLQLNPDTLVPPGAIQTLLEFMESHPQVGICGPKVLNADGSLQKSCRRGDSRPWAVFTYFSGLSRLFPRSKFFGGYHLNHLPEDAINPVDGVAGSCMLIRREVVNQIGYLDERYFAYQEDADYCFQARQAGWQVFYVQLLALSTSAGAVGRGWNHTVRFMPGIVRTGFITIKILPKIISICLIGCMMG